MDVFCEYTEREILRMLSENKNRENEFSNRLRWLLAIQLYLKCRADLNFEDDFGLNGAIGTVATWWDFILFGK